MAQAIDTMQERSRVSSTAKVHDLDRAAYIKPSAPKTDDIQTPRRHVSRWILLITFAAVTTAGLATWWLHAQHFESTDDAQIEGHLNSISARINGSVAYINPDVENNRYVEAGTLLLELDPNDYQVALDHAKADLVQRQATARSAALNVPITNANAYSQLHAAEAALSEAAASVDAEEANLVSIRHKVEQDEALYARAERDRARYQVLVDKREISRSEYDARETEATASAQALASDRALVTTAEQRITQARSRVAQKQAEVEAGRTAPQQVTEAETRLQSSLGETDQAKATVRTAELNLQYTKIYAPVSGVIGRKTVEMGQHIQPGQTLLTIVPLDDIWVTANFKETQLKFMRPGQPVRIHVDAFDRDVDGTIENLPGAAGTLFSLLPPENASGNFVKVIQRLPVRIRFNPSQDSQHTMRPGMSVEPTVTVR
jgi:membrane fusion protein (multidrug efflux system)